MTTVFHTNKPTTKWKGKTFQQISYSLKYNNEFNITDDKQLFRARPMKIYRKEVSSKDSKGDPKTFRLYVNTKIVIKYLDKTMKEKDFSKTVDYNNRANKSELKSLLSFILKNEIPFVKLLLDSHEDVFYKVFEKSLLYEGSDKTELRHISKNTCKEKSDGKGGA